MRSGAIDEACYQNGASLFYCLNPATVTYTGQPEKGIKSGDSGMFIEKCSKVFIVFMF